MTEDEHTPDSRETLRTFVQKSRILVDTKACMSEQFGLFLANITPFLEIYGKRLVISNSSAVELMNMHRSSDRESAQKAVKAIQLLKKLSHANLLAVMQDKGNSYLSTAESFRGKISMVCITHDSKCAEAINIKNNKFPKIEVRQINKYGFLSPYPVKPFYIVPTEEMYKGPFSIKKSSHVYVTGDTVFFRKNGQNQKLVLGQQLGKGGEGSVFEIDGMKKFVIKIFHTANADEERIFYSIQKLGLLVKSGIRHENIRFPITAVYDDSGTVTGYVMEKAEGTGLNKILIGSQHTIRKYLGENVTRKETVRLCVTILETVKFLHDNNIIIGDLRNENIIVKSPAEISIIDTDSFQINEYPCPVGTPLFTAPERINDDFSVIDRKEYMKKKSDDMFAVVTMLFQILMPGKEPYSKQDSSGNITEDIKKGDFAYAVPHKEKSSQAPRGNWRFCWSHISIDVRMMMYETFRKGEAHYLPQDRYNVNEWLKAFRNYYKEIESGDITDYDPMSLDLIPIRFVKSKRLKYGKCANPECMLDIVNTEELKQYKGYCYRCANEVIEEGICPECQENELIYRRIDLILNKPRPQKCSLCTKKELDSVYRHCVCMECGEPFDITYKDKKRIERLGYDMPKRCKKCRAEQRNNPQIKRKNSDENSFAGTFWGSIK